METIYIERLRELHTILSQHEDTPDVKFDMGSWRNADYDESNNVCGTSYCAAGLYVLKSKQTELIFTASCAGCGSIITNTKGESSATALANHFGLSSVDCVRIFYRVSASRKAIMDCIWDILNTYM